MFMIKFRARSFSWCLSGLDCHGCESCVFLRVGRLVTGQYILDGKVVGKVRLVGAVGIVTVVRVVFYSGSAGWSLVSIFGVVRWSGKLGWWGQYVCS